MKTLIIASVLFSNLALAGMKSNMPATYDKAGIPNAHLVSENVIRGMAPGGKEDLQRLLDLGVEKFLIFKIDTNGDVAKEKAQLQSLGVPAQNILHLDFPWKDITDYKPVCEMTVDALNMLKSSDMNNQKVYFHCTVGEDRTGYLAGLYKLYRGDSETRQEVFENELCDKGYEAGNPTKIYSVVKQVREALTPAFIGMADMIQKNPGKILTKAMCKHFIAPKVDFKVYSCKKSKLL